MVNRLLLGAVLLFVSACQEASLAPRMAQASGVPATPKAEHFTLRHPQLVTDAKGEILAIRSGRRLFPFKPGLADAIFPLLKSSDELGISAVARDDRPADSVYIVLSVTIDHKTFLVR